MPKANPIIALAKKLSVLRDRNEKLQQDMASVVDAISKELEKQNSDAASAPVAPAAPAKAKKDKAEAVSETAPKKRGRPAKK